MAPAWPTESARWARRTPCSMRPERESWPTRWPWRADRGGASPCRTRPPRTSASRCPSPRPTVLPVPWMRRWLCWPMAGSACARTPPCPCSRPPRPIANWKAVPSTSASSSLSNSAADGSGPRGLLRYRSAQGRWVVAAMILGSSVAGIDSTVVAVALPAIGRSLHVGFQGLQWIVTSYTLTLASLILVAGSLSDRWGRRRVFLLGLSWFTLASVLCAAAPGIGWLIAARAVQGIGGALMTPASLAIIEASFQPDERTQAIGTWAGFSGVSAAIAPFLGGWLLEAGSWRLIFLINVPVAA